MKRTMYERNIQDRSTLHYYVGLLVRWKQHFKYVKAVRIARKRGATIGEGVIMPLSLARKANKNLTIGNHVSIHTDKISSMRYKLTIGNNVIIGSDVNLVMGGHDIDSTEWEHKRNTPGLVIEDYVWICPNSMILPSCSRIGYGSVVGGVVVL